MQLSPGERLLALMLADVMTHLKVETDLSPEFIRHAIDTGNSWAIAEYNSILASEDQATQVVQETRQALAMWSMIERSVEALGSNELARLQLETDRSPAHFKFPGFDGNSEYRHMSAARFMIEQMGDFPEFEGRELNSHSPTVEITERMLPAYNAAVQRMGAAGALSVDDLVAIMNARKHPDAA